MGKPNFLVIQDNDLINTDMEFLEKLQSNCEGSVSKLCEFIKDFKFRKDYIIKDTRCFTTVAYFSLVVAEDMHLGRISQYITLYIVPTHRNNPVIRRLINDYSKYFALTHRCKYIHKVKHLNCSKTIRKETFKEVK